MTAVTNTCTKALSNINYWDIIYYMIIHEYLLLCHTSLNLNVILGQLSVCLSTSIYSILFSSRHSLYSVILIHVQLLIKSQQGQKCSMVNRN